MPNFVSFRSDRACRLGDDPIHAQRNRLSTFSRKAAQKRIAFADNAES
jgi:hypothetical protein